MKYLKTGVLHLAVLVLLFLGGCNGQTTNASDDTGKVENEQISEAENIKVIYFHFSRRCTTCEAVETEAEKAVAKLYPAEVKNGRVSFVTVNMDKEEGKKTAEKYGVNSQSLIILIGDTGNKRVNLTTQAFLHATTNPFKLRKSIQEAVDSYL